MLICRREAHLPFDRTFPEDAYPEYLTKDMLAAGYKKWAQTYGIVSSHPTIISHNDDNIPREHILLHKACLWVLGYGTREMGAEGSAAWKRDNSTLLLRSFCNGSRI